MCDYCNPDSEKCCIWKDSLTNNPYLDIETSEWDEYDDGYVHQREYISYCPYCGRGLTDDAETDSCDKYPMTHEDTDILGEFCQFSGIHGDDLRRILVKGYLANVRGEKMDKTEEFENELYEIFLTSFSDLSSDEHLSKDGNLLFTSFQALESSQDTLETIIKENNYKVIKGE